MINAGSPYVGPAFFFWGFLSMSHPVLTPEMLAVLSDLEAFGDEHDQLMQDRSAKMLNLERAAAELLHFQIVSGRRKRVLEIGTSNGYSTLWLAAAAKCIGGEPVISIERSDAKLDHALKNLQRVGLDKWVRLVEGEASDVVRRLDGPFDAVFFDADRISAPEQLALLRPKLSPGALLAADNTLSHPDEIAAYLAAVRAIPGVVEFTITVGKGLHLAVLP